MSLVNYFILSISCITAGVLGAIPGTISNQKCYEYLNIQDVPAVQPLTREELKTIITDESVNAPPIAAFAGGNNAKPIELPFMTREELKNILTDESVNAPPIAAFAGGKNAKPKELPFMAALGYDDGVGKKFNCGGNLISEQFVLTAAHCVYSIVWGYVKYVRLGDLNLTSTTDDNNAQEFTVIQYEVHPSYLYPKKYHDIALLKLDTPAIFTDYVRPVCLEPKRATLRSAIFYGAGWGALGFGEEASDHLQIGNLFHTPRETCKEIFGRDSTLPNGIVDDFQFCAGSTYKVADTCEGDSGGPLVYRKTYPHIISYLAGITSFGKACAISSVPGVYTRVSSYIDWIEKIVWPITANQRNIYDSLAFF